jgi:hypothetical protein
MTDSRFASALVLVCIAFVAVVYLPVAGLGFIKDDFAWITAAAETSSNPSAAFVRDASGTFYRPMVTLSFVGDLSLYGLSARGYGITNVLLLAACAASIVVLLRTVGLGFGAAVAGTLVWTANPHAINMAVLWISGRTSLLMTLFSCLSVVAFLCDWRVPGTLLLLAAVLSKEDAIAIPLIVLAMRRLVQGRKPPALAADAAWMVLALGTYAWMRADTNAISPSNAPSFYQLTSDPLLILRNLVAYLDRSATGAVVLALACMAAYRARPSFDQRDRRLLAMAGIWFLAGLAITVRVPVRSSLYALFPSVAAALAFAVTVEKLRASEGNRRRDRAAALVLAIPLLLAPVYYARNDRWIDPARVSDSAVEDLQHDGPTLPESGIIVFEDSRARFANFRDAFGPLSSEAVRLVTGKPFDAVVLPPGDTRRVEPQAARYALEGYEVRRVAP